MKAVQNCGQMPVNERFLSKEKLLDTMAREYISWLGLFTENKGGLEVLRNLGIFTVLQKLAEPFGLLDYLCVIIVGSFSFSFDDEPRIIFQLWLQKGSVDLVLFMLEHLRVFYRSGAENFSSWCIDILVTEIYSSEVQIAQKALNVLKEICEDEELMRAFLRKWPQLDQLKLGGDLFLARFLRTDIGIDYLQECSWIEPAIHRWINEGNANYVDQIEKAIFQGLNFESEVSKNDALQLHIPIDSPLDIRDDVKFNNKDNF